MKTALQSKKWFIFLLTFYSIIVNSQNLPRHQNERTYQEYMDKILDEIIKNDKDIFKNGILYDRVPHLAKLDKFNTGDNISNYNHFLRSWEELYQASIKPDFQNISSINKYALAKEMQGVIVIGAINIEFTTIDSTALSPKKPLMELKNGKLHHIKGNNAYIDNKSLVISALNSSKVDSLNLQFEFGKIFLNNSKNKIKEMVATFEGNQKVNLVKNGKINKEIFRVNFLSPGNKKIKFEATYKDGATNTTYADFLIDTSTQLKEIVSINSQSPIIPVKATKPFQGYDELADCGGNCFGEGEYQIFSSNTKLMKPFIIVDGFDPNDSRKIPDILSQMQYDGTSLHTTLLNQGFDVIVVNFPKYISGTYYYEYYDYDEYGNYVPIGSYIDNYRDGGTDYIERNAKVVESLLNKLNVELSANGSSNKIKIAGPSMGALIVQYALREMEKNNEIHNTDLFISFDGPHNGANAPIGAQKALQYFNIGMAKQALESPSAKQMLINHYLSNSDGFAFGAPNFRDRFQRELNNMGFPKNSRNIACINGSVLGEPKSQAGENMMHADLTGFIGFLRRIGYVNYTPDYGSKGVFRYLKLNWWGANVQDEIEKFTNTDANVGSLDNSPGGYLRLKGRIEETIQTTFPITSIYQFQSILQTKIGIFAPLALFVADIFIDHIYLNLTGDNTFVPTKSALAFRGNPLYKEKIGCRNLVCTGETPFDSYYAPVSNQEHASLHTEGVNWLMNEVLGNQQLPSVYNDCGLTKLSIDGENTLCYGTEGTYKAKSSCYNLTNSWTVSSNLQVLSSTNDEIKVKSNIDNHNSSGWIKAYLSNGEIITKDLVTVPSVSVELVNYSNFVKVNLIGAQININTQNVTNIAWEKIGGDGNLNFTNNSLHATASGYGYSWYVEGKATITNSCGISEVFFTAYPENTDPCLQVNKIATNEYQIVQPCELTPVQRVENVQLFDMYGQGKDVVFNSNKINLNGKALKGSVQILKVKAGDKVITKKIIID